MYSQMGFLHMVQKNAQIDELVDLYDAGGNKIELQSAQNLVFLNTHYWGGGCCDIWRSQSLKSLEEVMDQSFKTSPNPDKKNKKKFLRQNFSDKILECVSMSNIVHMAQIQMRVGKPKRVGQSTYPMILILV